MVTITKFIRKMRFGPSPPLIVRLFAPVPTISNVPLSSIGISPPLAIVNVIIDLAGKLNNVRSFEESAFAC